MAIRVLGKPTAQLIIWCDACRGGLGADQPVIAAPNPLRGAAADAHADSDLVCSIEAQSCSSLPHTASA
jgi:hypothetical protein